MKKISMICTFVVLIATKSFAADPVLTISAPDHYIPDTGITMTLSIAGDTANIGMTYVWQVWNHISQHWDSIPGTANNPEMLIFQESFSGSRNFRVNARNANGNYWPSNTWVLCHYGVLAVTAIDIFSGGIGSNGEAILQFHRTIYPRVVLQVSSDFQKTWAEVVDVTDDSSYVGHEKIRGTIFYRLEALQDDGTKRYGKPYRIKEIPQDEGIDFTKPVKVIFAINMAGELVSKEFKDVLVSGPKQAFDMATNGLSVGVYQVVCKQGNITKVLRNVKQ